MGCFSSKHVARSRSLRDDFSISLQRRTVGIPGLEDLFAASKNSTSTVAGTAAPDDFLALLCTANTVAMKLKEREDKLKRMSQQEEEGGLTSYESGTDDPPAVVNARGPEDEEHHTTEDNKDGNGKELVQVFHETINAWELMAGLEEYCDDQTTDTKKPHVRGEQEISGTARGFVSMGRPTKEEQDVGGRNDEGSSLSCVEDKRSSSTGTSVEQDAPVDKQVISSTKIGVDTASLATQPAKCPDNLLDKNAQLDNIPPTEIPTEPLKTIAAAKPAQVHSPPNSRPQEEPAAALKALAYSDSFRFTRTNALPEEDDTGKGVRRKARAKELKPLNVPAFEFDDIQNWLQGNDNQLYDSDPYETPKFGNYLKSIAKARKDASGELGPLDPDLVASLQETIDGMTAEEDRILKQFVEEFLEIHGSGGSF